MADDTEVPVILLFPRFITACFVLYPLSSHPHINSSLHSQVYTHTHNGGMAKQTTRMPLHVDSQQGFCSARMPPCLCHVFHIKVLVWWVPAGGRVGALSQSCACGPNPLINSGSTGRRWQVGIETGCAHLLSIYPCQTPRSLRLEYTHYC